MLRTALRFHVLKEFHGRLADHLRHPFQIFLALQVFDVVAGRAAAAVAVAEGQEKGIQSSLLHAAFPCLADLLRIGAVGVAGRQEGIDAGAVGAFPGEIVIRELVPFIIGPENLLGHKILDAGLFQNLRQRGGIAEGIRQPEDQGIHSEDIPEITFTMEHLADQGLAAGHIGVRFHPHGAFRDPPAFLRGLSDSFKKFRIIFPAHLIGSRLALQVPVIRIFVKQAKLRGESTAGLPVSFSHGPEPGQVQMRVADRVEFRHGRPVLRFENTFQDLPRLPVGRDPAFQGLFEINRDRGLFQRLRNLVRPQAFGNDLVSQLPQGIKVHIELIGILIPDAVCDPLKFAALSLFFRVLIAAGKNRPGRAAAQRTLGEEMPGVGFQQDIIAAPCFPAAGQEIVNQEMMRFFHPACTVCSEGPAVHKHGGFAACLKIDHDPFSLRFSRKGNLSAEPAVFPGTAPFCPFLHGGKRAFQGFIRGKLFHRQKAFCLHLAKRKIEIILQSLKPVVKAPLPLRMHVFHDPVCSFLFPAAGFAFSGLSRCL